MLCHSGRYMRTTSPGKYRERRGMLLPITLTFAATAALPNLLLAIRVSRFRVAHKILHCDGGNVALARRMRAHANYIETTPFILILTVLVELARGSEAWILIVALYVIVGSSLHVFDRQVDGVGRGVSV